MTQTAHPYAALDGELLAVAAAGVAAVVDGVSSASARTVIVQGDSTGPTGPTGPTGAVGDDGATGATGATGAVGGLLI